MKELKEFFMVTAYKKWQYKKLKKYLKDRRIEFKRTGAFKDCLGMEFYLIGVMCTRYEFEKITDYLELEPIFFNDWKNNAKEEL